MALKPRRVNPANRLSGVIGDGWLAPPNHYICPDCEHEIVFTSRLYEKALSAQWGDHTYNSNLEAYRQPTFEPAAHKHLARDEANFVLDFFCPSCDLVALITFEWTDSPDAPSPYRAAAVYELPGSD